MTRVIAFLLPFLIVSLCLQMAHAQPKSSKFGKIEDELIKMKSFEAYPEAAAVVLYDSKDAQLQYVNERFSMVYIIHKRIKILSPSAVDFGDIDISYYGLDRYEQVSSIKGITHNVDENGKIVETKLEKKDIFDEDEDGRYRNKRFSMPNVKAGSVIEISYRLQSKQYFSLRTHTFQAQIPVLYSEYSVIEPKGFNYQPLFSGSYVAISKDRKNHSIGNFDGDRVTYIARNVEALTIEPYATSFRNFVSRLDYQLVNINLPGYIKDFNRTWKQINQERLESADYNAYLKPRKAITSLLPEIIGSVEADAKIGAIIQYVRNKIAWDGRRGIYPSKTPRELLAEKKANGASINLMLISLLRAAGYDANPVLISTREHGAIQRSYALLNQFNHVIVRVNMDGGMILLDGTGQSYAYDMLPFQDLNHDGFQLVGDEGQWMKIKPKYESEELIMATFKLNGEGMLEGSFKVEDKGYSAATGRHLYRKNEKDAEKYIQDRIMDEIPSGEIVSQKVEGAKEVNKPFLTECEVSTSDFIQQTGGFMYVKPLMHLQIRENPFKIKERNYPVDFGYPIKQKYILNLELPEGYTVESVPKAVRASLPDKSAKFEYMSQVVANRLQLIMSYEIKETSYVAEKYQDIKSFYDLIVEKHGEQIVLKKQE